MMVAKNPELLIIASQVQCVMKYLVVEDDNSYEDEY
jgi:hypothetical protein